MNIKIISFFVLMAFLTVPFNSHAQTDRFQDMQRQMMEMQRQMMKSLQNNPFFGDLSEQGRNGRDTSSFFFRLDTSFSEGNSRSFRFDTTFSNGSGFKLFFGGDSITQQFFQGFGQIFGDMMDMGDGFGQEQDNQNTHPKDDGHHPNEDGLLPEERIRQSEDQESVLGNGGDEKPKAGSKTAPKKSKIKTTRI